MKTKILIQLDTDAQPSVFDRIVAVDAGAEQVFAHGAIKPEQVRDLVYGAIFTRGPQDLHATAVFIGGSDVAAGEALLARARESFLGKLRVSLLLDSGGANTTAAAAVLTIERHLDLQGRRALVLGGTGPVGQRVARLLLRGGAEVRIGSRSRDKAESVVKAMESRLPASSARPTPWATSTADALARALDGVEIVVSAGGAGVALLPASERNAAASLKILVDLNAVPPPGIEGVGPMDSGAGLAGAKAFGAIAVGSLKMKIHKAAVARLFSSNDQLLDAEEIFEIGRGLTR